MVKHLVSVCIFCFLCATHSPCASHADVAPGGDARIYDPTPPFRDPWNEDFENRDFSKNEVRHARDVNSNVEVQVSGPNDGGDEDYVKKLFIYYGDGSSLSLEGLRRLMKTFDGVQRNVHHGDVQSSVHHGEVHDHDELEYGVNDNSTNSGEDYQSGSSLHAWMYSLLATLLISACGILGLLVIPVMQKTFYQPLLQFLVALAVGTLAGDALLHLLPHAMMSPHGGHEDEHSRAAHQSIMWKGFVAMLGLIFFFLMERIIILVAKWRKKQQLKDKLPSRLKVIKPEISTQLTNAAEKQCKHKYSSFPYCYDEIKMDGDVQNDNQLHWESHNNTTSTGLNELGNHSHSDIQIYKLPARQKQLEANQNMTECPNDNSNSNCSEINKMLGMSKMLNNEYKEDNDSIEYTVILREHENNHHGHSHTHGHVHAAPKTMSSVAWMVIMGDGLHNFTDGMAIGAAFASGTAGGFSTAVAVFCHELPHELGDFAMLLKAGMSMKQALFYNLLSSVLCLFGNIFGVWLGNTETASQWIFAAAAGMFLYIALVDMIPELSSGHEAEGTFQQCALHLSGLLLGFGVMTLIALYEPELKSLFNEP